jgi:hypothetical protein
VLSIYSCILLFFRLKDVSLLVLRAARNAFRNVRRTWCKSLVE